MHFARCCESDSALTNTNLNTVLGGPKTKNNRDVFRPWSIENRLIDNYGHFSHMHGVCILCRSRERSRRWPHSRLMSLLTTHSRPHNSNNSISHTSHRKSLRWLILNAPQEKLQTVKRFPTRRRIPIRLGTYKWIMYVRDYIIYS